MKKLITILTIFVLSLVVLPDISNQTSENCTSQKFIIEKADIIEPSDLFTDNTINNENIVFRTRTGKRYHTSGCRYLHSSCIEISLKNAQKTGIIKCTLKDSKKLSHFCESL